jgi:thiol-disulfide isomerase/thioredoxin
MNTSRWKRAGVVVAACVVALTFAADEKPPSTGASSAKEDAAETAWQGVLKALRPPPAPEEWRTNPPSKEQIAEYEKKNGELAGQAADKAKDFYTKYPGHEKAGDARKMEVQLLGVAVQLGSTNRQAQFEALQEKRLSDPSLPADEKFNLRAQRIVKMLSEDETTNRAPLLAKAEQAVRELQKEFPKRDEGYELMQMVAQGYLDADNAPKARAVTEEIAKGASGDNKQQAQALLRKIDLVGKPFDLKFADLSGKEISVKDYAGKVVLVDFWATWCGPCRATLPEVKETYAKYHSKGFEIVGISLDKDKDALQTFIKDENMSWPQYFDGLGWENKISQKYEISSIPTVWIVDKKGNLRDLNGRQSLAAKLEKLLAEK